MYPILAVAENILVLIAFYLCINWQLHRQFIYDLIRIFVTRRSENIDFVPQALSWHVWEPVQGDKRKVFGSAGLNTASMW